MSKIVICDIDNTLSDSRARADRYINIKATPDWDGFFANVEDDEPLKPIVSLVQNLRDVQGYEVIVSTGRSVACEEQTMRWLFKHVFDPKNTESVPMRLFMRARYDRRPQEEVKHDILRHQIVRKEDVAFVIDDDPKALEMYRRECPNAVIIDVRNYLNDKEVATSEE